MMPQQTPGRDPVPMARRGPGERVKAARLKAGRDIEWAAAQLRLRKSVIEALEANDYERLPPPVFVQGYLRSYADILGLPIPEIVQEYRDATAPPVGRPEHTVNHPPKPVLPKSEKRPPEAKSPPSVPEQPQDKPRPLPQDGRQERLAGKFAAALAKVRHAAHQAEPAKPESAPANVVVRPAGVRVEPTRTEPRQAPITTPQSQDRRPPAPDAQTPRPEPMLPPSPEPEQVPSPQPGAMPATPIPSRPEMERPRPAETQRARPAGTEPEPHVPLLDRSRPQASRLRPKFRFKFRRPDLSMLSGRKPSFKPLLVKWLVWGVGVLLLVLLLNWGIGLMGKVHIRSPGSVWQGLLQNWASLTGGEAPPSQPAPVGPEPHPSVLPPIQPLSEDSFVVDGQPLTDSLVDGEGQEGELARMPLANGGRPKEIVVELKGLSWVEIEDATGDFRLVGEMQKGERHVLKGKPPYRMLFGRGNLVKLTVNGEPYDFSRQQQGSVARFNLDP